MLYGENDWVKSDGAYRYKEEHGREDIIIEIIPNAGHTLNIQGVDDILNLFRKHNIIK